MRHLALQNQNSMSGLVYRMEQGSTLHKGNHVSQFEVTEVAMRLWESIARLQRLRMLLFSGVPQHQCVGGHHEVD